MRDDIPVASLDPDRAEEVAYLRQSFPAMDVKLFFVLHAVAQYADTRGRDGVDSELQRVLTIFNRVPGLGGPPRSEGEVDAAFGERFPNQGRYQGSPRVHAIHPVQKTEATSVFPSSHVRSHLRAPLVNDRISEGFPTPLLAGPQAEVQARCLL